MMELANVKEDDVFYDLGCGDGRVLIKVAKEKKIRCVGIEIIRRSCGGGQEESGQRGARELDKDSSWRYFSRKH
jgi:tRNA G46 methylase TrmB